MTNQPTGVISRYASAWASNDLGAMIASYGTDVVVHYGGRSTYAGSHHGRDRLVEILLESAARSDRQLVSIDQVHDHGASGAIFATETFRVHGEVIAVERALRYRCDGDQIVEVWLYDRDQHIVDQAWAQPVPAPMSVGDA